MATNRPTTFYMLPRDLERIQAMQQHPFVASQINRYRELVEPQRSNGIEPWDGTSESHNRTAEFLCLLDMGLLYLLTGETKYRDACVRDVLTFVSICESNTERAMTESRIEQTMINRSLLFVLDWLNDGFTEQEKLRVRKACLFCVPRHLEPMAKWTVLGKLLQNHLLADSTGTAEVLLYFNDLPESRRWADFASGIAVQYMRDGFHPDGAQNELSPSYHTFCMVLGLILAHTLRNYTDRDLFREPWFLDVYRNGLDWMGSLLTPEGGFVAFNDHHDAIPDWLFRFGASTFRNPHYQWIAEQMTASVLEGEKESRRYMPRRVFGGLFLNLLYFDPSVEAVRDSGARGVFPQSTTAAFRKAGAGGIRQDSLLSCKAGSYTGGHAHADRLVFDYWYNGKHVLPDKGVNIQSSLPDAGWFKNTTSHNVLAVHEPHEIGRWNSEEKFPVAHRKHSYAQGRILTSLEADTHALLVVQAEIYPGCSQTRVLLWWKPDGRLLCRDRVEGKESLTWDQLFHGQGKLVVDGNQFVFDGEGGLAGTVLQSTAAEVVPLNRPDGVEGPDQYVAVRQQGASVSMATLLQPGTSVDASGKGGLSFQADGTDIQVTLKPDTITIQINGKTAWEAQ